MVIEQLSQITPAWLTEVLRAKSALLRGEVTQIDVDSAIANKGLVAEITTLKVHYSSAATGALPQSLLLKKPKPDLHPELLSRGAHEAKFYQTVATLATKLPLPTCYSVEYDAATQRSHILMENLSGTHFQRPLPIPPSQRHCELIVESLAQLHAAWWNSPQLGTEIGERLDQAKAEASRQRLINTLPAFFDYLGDALLPHQRQAIEQIIAADFLVRLAQRLCDLRQITLTHGDVHTGNIMLPYNWAQHRVVLIDWQLWDINVGAMDLAFLMALHWSPERRSLLETALLRRYHTALQTCGVADYDWDDLWDDYRTAVIIMALIPIGQFRRKSPAGVIWFGLQDSLAAFADLHCAALL